MQQDSIHDFIVIDDDPINNIICTKVIELTVPGATVCTFLEPELGLEYLRVAYPAREGREVIVFLDINMPSLTGWEVLDIFTHFPAAVREHVTIYMLSSSVDPNDQQRADEHPLVAGYVIKSLSQAKLRSLMEAHQELVLRQAG